MPTTLVIDSHSNVADIALGVSTEASATLRYALRLLASCSPDGTYIEGILSEHPLDPQVIERLSGLLGAINRAGFQQAATCAHLASVAIKIADEAAYSRSTDALRDALTWAGKAAQAAHRVDRAIHASLDTEAQLLAG